MSSILRRSVMIGFAGAGVLPDVRAAAPISVCRRWSSRTEKSYSVRCAVEPPTDAVEKVEPKLEKPGSVSRPFLKLKPGKSKLFYNGNVIVLEQAVDRLIGADSPPDAGDLMPLVDHNGKTIGWGAFNGFSRFRFRILHHAHVDGYFDLEDQFDLNAFLRARLQVARDLRTRLCLPNSDTNAYRLVNGEGDRLSGLYIDVFNEHVVIESSAAWVERHRAEIEAATRSVFDHEIEITWRRSPDKLKQEGLTVSELDEAIDVVKEQPQVIREHGLEFEVETRSGQKTGFYCDQRENRGYIGSIAKGADVLDCFCYTGGFGIHAGANGAKSVTVVDSSASGLEAALRNADRNHVKVDAQKADVFTFLNGIVRWLSN